MFKLVLETRRTRDQIANIFWIIKKEESSNKSIYFCFIDYAKTFYCVDYNLENSAVATRLEKLSFIPIPKKGNAKKCSNYRIIALISHPSKVMLKILQARLQQYMNC